MIALKPSTSIAMDQITESDLQHFRSRLEERRNALLQIAATGREAAGTVKLDQTAVGRLSRMDAMQAQAMSQETNRRREDELRRISAALRRMQEGTYGECIVCGEPIARGRLDFDPSMTHCIKCANEAE